jgi:hypothetical protein
MSDDVNRNQQKEDFVYYGSGGTCSMPRDLFVRPRRLPWLCGATAVAIFGLFPLCEAVPTHFMLWLAQQFNDLFWVHFKQISFDGCAEKCQMMAYSTVAIPISWVVTIAVTPAMILRAVEFWEIQQQALRRGAAPRGRDSDRNIRQLPGLSYCVWASILAIATLVLLETTLYLLVGSDSTVSRGRRFSPTQVCLHITILISFGPIVTGVTVGVLTCLFRSIERLYRH